MGKLHQEVTVEYVRRLLKGAKLKNEEQQAKACNTVRDNAESLYKLFLKMVRNRAERFCKTTE